MSDYWTSGTPLGQAEQVSSSASTSEESVPVIPRPPTTESCWTTGCEEPRSEERNGYWCTHHHDERRERIASEMAKIKNDSSGIPRNYGGIGRPYTDEELVPKDAFDQAPVPNTHIIVLKSSPTYDGTGDRDGYKWWWECSCGGRAAGFSRLEGIARGGGARHRTASMRAPR